MKVVTEVPDDLFVKLPLGGFDRRVLLKSLAEQGPVVARTDLASQRGALSPAGLRLPSDHCVLLLGGSNGILRALAIQLLFGERVPVWAVHYDSEKLQIGPHHARAMIEAAQAEQIDVHFHNTDASRPEVIAATVERLRGRYRVVHLVNGIAAGATKRFEEHGKVFVPDLDVAFDPVRQTPDFSQWTSVRKLGHVEVDIATPQDIERTHKLMGTSTTAWTDALTAAGLLVPEESVVAFADYDYEPEDPVYAMGPLASAKNLQREAMAALKQQHPALRTVRLCYPAMNTTAIGAIPGAMLLYAMTTEILLERGEFQSIAQLARESLPLFDRTAPETLRLDAAYQRALPEFHARRSTLDEGSLRANIGRVVGTRGV